MIAVNRIAPPAQLADWNTLGLTLSRHRKQYYVELDDYYNRRIPNRPKEVKADKKIYAHSAVKLHLNHMFNGKCCYCESQVTHTGYLAVEHFRPQSVYPSVAYKWENLLYACDVCNSGYKKGVFPICDRGNAIPDKITPESMDDSDDGALIDPTREDPNQYIKFDREIALGLDYRGTITIEVCGLNREPLRERRRKIIIKLRKLADAYINTNPSDLATLKSIEDKIKDYLDDDDEYLKCKRDYLESRNISI